MKYYYDTPSDEPGCCVGFMRFVFLTLSVILFIGSIVVIAGGVVMKQKNDLVKFCSVCNQLYLYVIVTAAILAAVSLVGIIALMCRNGCMIVLYGIVQSLLFVLLLGMIVVVVLFKMNRLNDILVDAWKVMPDDARCAMEKGSKCSGWDTLCAGSTVYNKSALCPMCENDQPVIGKFNTTCHALFKSEVDKWYAAVIGVCAALAVTCILSILVGCKLVRKDTGGVSETARYT